MKRVIEPAQTVRGEVALPGDKSISHRVVFAGSIARGKTVGKHFLGADDCLRTVEAFRSMGIAIDLCGEEITVHGRGLGGLQDPGDDLYLGNSGTTMRIMPGILAGHAFRVTMTGDDSLSKRPMTRIIEPLRKMGVDISSRDGLGLPPLIVKGGEVRPVSYGTNVASAQVKSCILFAGLYAKGVTSVTEPYLSRDHTERILEGCGAKIVRNGLTVSVTGGPLDAGTFFIPGDISSAAFFIAAACILEGADIVIRDVGLNPTRMGFVNALQRMGADIAVTGKKERFEPYGDIRARYRKLSPTIVEADRIPLLIDEIPVLAVVASTVRGTTVMKGCAELRVKETDRIGSMVGNLRSLGVDAEAQDDTLVVHGKRERFTGASVRSFGDHRTAMSMAIAGLFADGSCEIDNVDCINTSFPEFFDIARHLVQ